MTEHPNEYLQITKGELQGLEGAGVDETGDSFASTESRIKYVNKICKTVRSRPLSSELKKERERVLDKYLDELQKEIGESMDYIDWDSVEAVYIRVRGEL